MISENVVIITAQEYKDATNTAFHRGVERGRFEQVSDNGKLIPKNTAEQQSGLDRVRFAEGLIKQLPETHNGRNTWLLNYGTSDEAITIRRKNGIGWDEVTQAAPTFGALSIL